MRERERRDVGCEMKNEPGEERCERYIVEEEEDSLSGRFHFCLMRLKILMQIESSLNFSQVFQNSQ